MLHASRICKHSNCRLNTLVVHKAVCCATSCIAVAQSYVGIDCADNILFEGDKVVCLIILKVLLNSPHGILKLAVVISLLIQCCAEFLNGKTRVGLIWDIPTLNKSAEILVVALSDSEALRVNLQLWILAIVLVAKVINNTHKEERCRKGTHILNINLAVWHNTATIVDLTTCNGTIFGNKRVGNRLCATLVRVLYSLNATTRGDVVLCRGNLSKAAETKWNSGLHQTLTVAT